MEQSAAQLAPYVAWGAFILAFIFGAVGNKTNFCTMGAVSDWVNMGDLNRMRMWLLAIGVAILGANALQLAGLVDLSKSIYPGPNFTWLSYIVGGFLWVWSMVFVGFTLGRTVPNIDKRIHLIIAAVLVISVMPAMYHAWKVRRAKAAAPVNETPAVKNT